MFNVNIRLQGARWKLSICSVKHLTLPGYRTAAVNQLELSQCYRGHNKPFGMGGDHGHSKLSMPDWKQWKTEGTPLEFTQQRLAARGLKDPWARNEAWRYSGGFARAVTLSDVLLRGFKWGFAAFTVALAIEYVVFSS
ncbi:hypothetical protein OJAV_G00172120 [Oryzias javanicus]|uniref:NADH dehydrogenase [ubiquinone] 1 beta subcomplex subunit 3 n=1 Tax=Oryzias javanicus TaxID=123683 RepID=A0A437CFG1_ORYJA|nr:hypothetical protein OJAV_G00172120 [Oryzias javanicus]